ncbi:uncharacterized protein CDAR_370451 [Caerostris darwini]|uniref:Uncharacterized protein n=1 Tax=Caerostris darwini TaxID=1538125 RepID=A0AAV4V3A1_9ARAC|nr:uncharacterized protein CDAR_370451 [Caerostris darwini]
MQGDPLLPIRISEICNSNLTKKAAKATALLFPLLGIPHLLFCINPKDNGTLEEAYMIVNAFIKSSQVSDNK